MIKLDDNLLAELGLQSLPPEEKKNLLRHIYETLEMRVGTTLAQQMTDAQLDEFESFINANDEAGALRWLETNFPNYKDVVAQEFEKLKQEVRQSAPQILANVAAMPQQQPMAPQYQQPYPPQQPMQPQMAPAGYPQQPYAAPAPQPGYYPQPQQPMQAPAMPQQAPAPQQMQQPMPQQQPQPMYQPAPAADPSTMPQQAPAPVSSGAPQYPQPVPVPPMPTPAPGVQPSASTDQNQYGQAA